MHAHIGDVHGPDLIGMDQGIVLQKIRVDFVLWVTDAGAGFAVQRLNAHALHQDADMPAPYAMALPLQQPLQHSRARKGVGHMQCIQAVHELYLVAICQLAGGNTQSPG